MRSFKGVKEDGSNENWRELINKIAVESMGYRIWRKNEDFLI